MTKNISEDSYAKTLANTTFRVRQLERRPCATCGAGANPMETYTKVSIDGTNPVVITPCPAVFYGHQVGNTDEIDFRYILLFNQATLPVSASSNLQFILSIPWDSGANQEYPNGIEFPDGIAMAFSTSPTSLVGVTAGDVIANIAFIGDCAPSSSSLSVNTSTSVQTSVAARRRTSGTTIKGPFTPV